MQIHYYNYCEVFNAQYVLGYWEVGERGVLDHIPRVETERRICNAGWRKLLTGVQINHHARMMFIHILYVLYGVHCPSSATRDPVIW